MQHNLIRKPCKGGGSYACITNCVEHLVKIPAMTHIHGEKRAAFRASDSAVWLGI